MADAHNFTSRGSHSDQNGRHLMLDDLVKKEVEEETNLQSHFGESDGIARTVPKTDQITHAHSTTYGVHNPRPLDQFTIDDVVVLLESLASKERTTVFSQLEKIKVKLSEKQEVQQEMARRFYGVSPSTPTLIRQPWNSTNSNIRSSGSNNNEMQAGTSDTRGNQSSSRYQYPTSARPHFSHKNGQENQWIRRNNWNWKSSKNNRRWINKSPRHGGLNQTFSGFDERRAVHSNKGSVNARDFENDMNMGFELEQIPDVPTTSSNSDSWRHQRNPNFSRSKMSDGRNGRQF